MMLGSARTLAWTLVGLAALTVSRAHGQYSPYQGPPALHPSSQNYFSPANLGYPGAAPGGVMSASYTSPEGYYPGPQAAPPVGPPMGPHMGAPLPPTPQGAMPSGCQKCGGPGGKCDCGPGPGYGWGLCDPDCGRFHGQGIWRKHGPEGTAGCCNPRWFDIHAEFMYLTREDVSRRTDFTFVEVPIPNTTAVIPVVVLSSDSLNFHEEPGFRVTGNYMIGPGDNIEASYFGVFNWVSNASVAAEDALLSFFEPNVGDPIFPSFNQADVHSLAYSSAINSVEINFRRRWVSPHCRIHSSVLFGARYVSLEEDLIFSSFDQTVTVVQDPQTGQETEIIDLERGQYAVQTVNDLMGFQLGGDVALCVVPRFKVAVEAEAGVYGTRAEQQTAISSETQSNLPANQIPLATIEEFDGQEDISFVGEAGISFLFHCSERITIRGGYQLLYVDGIALAIENVNFSTPLNPGGQRENIVVNDNGDVFYHGFTAGLEYTW